MKTIKTNCEFASELICVIPYAYWLHQNNQLEKVITSKGMKPFYYFCDSVEEKYEHRSIDNLNNGVQNLPNTWIHHNAVAHFGKDYSELTEEEKTKANGWLDYSQWECPPYRQEYYEERAEPKSSGTESSVAFTERYIKWQENLEQCKNLADIIIAKQRHGPIGSLQLHFDSKLTKFSNYADDKKQPSKK